VHVQADWVLLKPEDLDALTTGQDPKQPKSAGVRVLDASALSKIGNAAIHYRAEVNCFNGQTVSMSSGRSRTAIVNQTPVVGQNAGALSASVRQVVVGAMLEVTPTIVEGNAVVDVRSEVADWDNPGVIDVSPNQVKTGANGASLGGVTPAVIDRLNILDQELRTTAQIPVGKPVLIGGMTLEPATNQPPMTSDVPAAIGGMPPEAQLYLILQVSSGR